MMYEMEEKALKQHREITLQEQKLKKLRDLEIKHKQREENKNIEEARRMSLSKAEQEIRKKKYVY